MAERPPGEAVDRLGDEALAPGRPRGVDAALATARCGRLGGQQPPLRAGQRRVAEQRAGGGRRARRAGTARADVVQSSTNSARDRRDGVDRAGQQRMAALGVADRVAQHVGEPPRAVVAQQRQPRLDRAGDGGGERPGARYEVEAEAAVVGDGRAGRRGALSAQDTWVASSPAGRR